MNMYECDNVRMCVAVALCRHVVGCLMDGLGDVVSISTGTRNRTQRVSVEGRFAGWVKLDKVYLLIAEVDAGHR